MKNKDNLTNSIKIDEDVAIARLADQGRNQPSLPPNEELDKPQEKPRLRDDPEFKAYVAEHLWENRRERDYAWQADVIGYIEDTYGPWLGHGLLQSDFKDLDPKLYAKFHKHLHQVKAEQGQQVRDDIIEYLNLPAERSEAALQHIDNPIARAQVEAVRRYHRERSRRYRASLKP